MSIRLPQSKSDVACAQEIVGLGYPAVEGVIPQLLEWIQDLNWPVASVFAPFLAKIGLPLLPHVRSVLATDDATWKYSLIVAVVKDAPELAEALRPELTRIAVWPADAERDEELDQVAREALSKLRAASVDWTQERVVEGHAARAIERALRVRARSGAQDWDVELASKEIAAPAVTLYEHGGLTEDEIFALGSLLFAALDERLDGDVERRFATLAVRDAHILASALRYWALLDELDPGNVFRVTPFARAVVAAIGGIGSALTLRAFEASVREQLGGVPLVFFRACVRDFVSHGGDREQARRLLERMRGERPEHEDQLLEILDIVTGW